MARAKSSAFSCRAAVLGALIATGTGLAPAIALALPGYANLINGYCRAQGAPRVQYTDDGCTLCHHPGTFTAEPAHRVEPAWSEFELGRASGSYAFFCPGPSDTVSTSTAVEAPAMVSPAMPAIGAPVSHAEMPWMSLGYPVGHATTESVDAAAKPEPLQTAAPEVRSAERTPVSNAASSAGTASAVPSDLKMKLEKLAKDLAISAPQQPAWTDLQAAILAAQATPDSGDGSARASSSLTDRLANRQRQHAWRIAQLRAVNTATVRLNASLNERQQRLLAARLPPLLGDL